MGTTVSMTGFGRGEASSEEGSWIVELRAVNHRYLDISLKLPRRFIGWAAEINQLVANIEILDKLCRVELAINFVPPKCRTRAVEVNQEVSPVNYRRFS